MVVVKRRRLHSQTFSDIDSDDDPSYVPSDCSPNRSDSDTFPVPDEMETGNEEPHVKTQVTSSKSAQCSEEKERKQPYKKPYRFCMYCKKHMSKLSDHFKNKHRNEERIQYALGLPTKERIEEFDRIRKEGTFEVNKIRAKDDNPQFQRERSSASNSVVICSNCSGAYSAPYMRRHKHHCEYKSDSSKPSMHIPASFLSVMNDSDSSFISEILSKFRKDEVGQLCQSDPILREIGKRLWLKQNKKPDKKTEVRKSVMTDMRRLARLYLTLISVQDNIGPLLVKAGNVSDLMQRSNFQHLEVAVQQYTERREEGEGLGVKAGLKLGVFYLLKSSSKILKAMYLMDDKDNEADQIDRFTAVLDLQHNQIFGDATYHLNKRREEKLRRPSGQPLEADIKAVRDYTTSRITKLLEDTLAFWDRHRFVELRDCLVSRLTLFNARRGGEPSRLYIKCWQDAKEGAWLDKQQLATLDSIDKALVEDLKVGYQLGKGKHLIPVLFPTDTHEALDKLINKEIRSCAGIGNDNNYLFPTTSGSNSNVSGWHALDNICECVTLDDKQSITATKNRHRVSVLFALSHIPERERSFIFKHLGHSQETNENIYQAPLALKEVTVVGRQPQMMDTGDK
nr:uncharacterized protein LOC129267799 [Lytechinus pictus]